MLCYMHFGTVNSLVSDYPWFTTKWSLTGGCHLWEKNKEEYLKFLPQEEVVVV